MTSTFSFFDTLCFSELENVLLHLSARPNLHEWSEGVSDLELQTVFHSNSSFRPVVKTFLATELRQVWKKVRSETRFTELSTLVAAGDLLTSVTLSTENVTALAESALVSSFSQRTPNLRSLALTGSLGDELSAYNQLLTRIGKKLKEIRVEQWTTAWLPAIVERTCRPRELTIQCKEEGAVADERFWKKLGPKLQKLTITYHSNILWLGDEGVTAKEQLKHIEKHCKALRAMCVFTPPEAAEGLTHALCSVGSRLKHGFLWLPSSADATQVRQRCPNARFGLLLRSNEATGIIRCFANRLDDLRLIGDIGSSSEYDLQNSLGNCIELRKLYTDVDVHLAFPLPALSELVDLELNPDVFRVAPDDVLHALAQCTSALRHLTLFLLPPTIAPLLRLVEGNPELGQLKWGVCRPSEEDPVEQQLPHHQLSFDEDEDVDAYYALFLRGLAKLDTAIYKLEIESRWDNRPEGHRSEIIAKRCNDFRYRKLYFSSDSWSYLPNDQPS